MPTKHTTATSVETIDKDDFAHVRRILQTALVRLEHPDFQASVLGRPTDPALQNAHKALQTAAAMCTPTLAEAALARAIFWAAVAAIYG